MKIPVFVSCPTTLNKAQEAARQLIIKELDSLNLEARALGRTDYPKEYPLREVLVIGRHCSGGVILGFSQVETSSVLFKKGTVKEEKIDNKTVLFPSPWNNLEAGILFGLGLPLLIFREEGINGGVFDPGVTDVFIQNMPIGQMPKSKKEALREVFLSWHGLVRAHYYGEQANSRR